MRFQFCKNSVFSILFLISFLIGTICGILLFRAVHILHPSWIVEYASALSSVSTARFFRSAFFLILPFLPVWLIGQFPNGYRFVPLLTSMRGCFLSYCLSCCYVGGVSSLPVVYRNAFFVPLYYLFCQYVWVCDPVDRYKL